MCSVAPTTMWQAPTPKATALYEHSPPACDVNHPGSHRDVVSLCRLTRMVAVP